MQTQCDLGESIGVMETSTPPGLRKTRLQKGWYRRVSPPGDGRLQTPRLLDCLMQVVVKRRDADYIGAQGAVRARPDSPHMREEKGKSP